MSMLAYQPVPPTTPPLAHRRPIRIVLGFAAILIVSACGDAPSGIVVKKEPAQETVAVNGPAIDSVPANTQAKIAAGGPDRRGQPELGPQDALVVVEQSKLEFIAPQRKGKQKLYTAREFADMLRRKWDWLGADVEDLESFIAEIASESFSAFEPYRVRHADGREQDFSNWLRAELGQTAAAPSAPKTGAAD